MNARDYLMQSLRIRESLHYINERIEKLKTDLEYHPKELDDSGASHLNYREDKFSEKMAEIADLEAEWEQKRIDLEKKNAEIRETVESLQNAEYVAVLTARYLTENRRTPCRLNSWVAVAFKLGMTSEEAVKQKHKRALRALQKIIS
jgi:chromosome segregation ATPase